MHLKDEQLIDLAEGTVDEGAFPHLASCDSCRRQLIDLRAAMASVLDGDGATVPEPPPFFWSQLQHRVDDAIARSPSTGIFGRWLLHRPPVLVPFSALALVAIVLLLWPARLYRHPVPPVTPSTAAVAFEPLDDSFDDDPSLQLVADLADSMDAGDPAAVSEAGLTAAGSAEHAVAHLSAPELQELRKLLRAELGT
jgi:hypothetical protein